MNLEQAQSWEAWTKDKSPNGAGLFCTVRMQTVVKLRKTHKEDRTIRRDFELIKHTEIIGDCMLGLTAYEDKMRRIDPDYEPRPMNGRTHISAALLVSDRDPDQHYVVLYFIGERVRVRYTLDGETVELTDPRVAPYYTQPKESAAPIVIRTPKLESVVYVKCGAFVYGGELPPVGAVLPRIRVEIVSHKPVFRVERDTIVTDREAKNVPTQENQEKDQ